MHPELVSNASPFSRGDPYVCFLLENRRRVFYMKPWNGNGGDVLIWLGTERILRDLGIPRTLDPRAADVILIPGGNQTMWQANVNIWKQVWSRYPDKDFVVGPTTVQFGVTTWLHDIRTSHARITGFFARDPQSEANLKSCGLDREIMIGLSHDPALYLRDSDLVRAHRDAATNDFVLAAFRHDMEGTKGPSQWLGPWAALVPPRLLGRMDCYWRTASQRRKVRRAAEYTRRPEPLRVCDPSNHLFEYFVEIIRSAAEVHTDRLHCMLLAVMLGKPTFAYPTSYAKLEAIYAHSVRQWAQVEFVAGTESPRDRPLIIALEQAGFRR